MRISDWSSDVCSSDLRPLLVSGGNRSPDRRREYSRRAQDHAGAFGSYPASMTQHGGAASAGACPPMPPGDAGESQVLRTCTRTCTNAFDRSEEHTSELQSLMRISYAAFRLQKKRLHIRRKDHTQ